MSLQNALEGSIPSSPRNQQHQHQNVVIAMDWALLPLLMAVTPLFFFFRTQYNLPVAANVDERTALDIFQRFQNGGLNPHYFLYPTLYYYVTYFFVKVFTPSMVLVGGRILNLAFVGLTSFLAYCFCRIYFLSRAAGILSALFIATSPIILNSGSYICTDALLAAMTLAGLLLLVQYFQKPTHRNWTIAMIMLGIAVGCKYTAFLLFVAYVGTEMMHQVRGENRSAKLDFEPRIPRSVLSSVFAFLGCLLLIIAWLFPLADLMRFATTHHTNPDLRSSAEYLTFFHHLRMILIFAGTSLVTLALLVAWSEYCYRLISLRRLYLGLIIVLLAALLTTPYSILDPAKFIYDIGAQARATVMLQNAQTQWHNYYLWLKATESKTLLTLGLFGFVTIGLRNYRNYLVVIVFSVLYVFTIGRAHIGFPRYLIPILPLIYVFAAGFLLQIWSTRKSASFPYTKILAVLLLIVATAELWPKLGTSYKLSKQTDEFWSSYSVTMNLHPAKVLYAGNAPSAELRAAGVSASQTSWASLASRPMGDQLECGELLILDRRAAESHHVAPEDDSSVIILLDDRIGDYGQELLRKADCK
jgi:4-amino-4-deoxy-L-arabinose transferase-like glycosyltransferase